MNWLTLILLNALSLVLVDYLLAGIVIKGIIPALLAGLALGVVNTIVRPVLMLLTLPFTILSLGLFLLIVNAFTFALTALLVPGFEILSVGGAFWGAIFTSITGWLLSIIFGRS